MIMMTACMHSPMATVDRPKIQLTMQILRQITVENPSTNDDNDIF